MSKSSQVLPVLDVLDADGNGERKSTLQYSPSMFEATTTNSDESQNIIGIGGGSPSIAEGNNIIKNWGAPSQLLPSALSQMSIVFTNPAMCGYACQKRFARQPGTATAATPAAQPIGIDSLSFEYEWNGTRLIRLQEAFEHRFGKLHKLQFRYSCVGGILTMLVYAGYDWFYYSHEDYFTHLLIIRFAGFLPCLIGACALTCSKQYWNPPVRNAILAVLSFALGMCIVVYSYVTEGQGQGVLALYFALLFFLTPLPFDRQLAIGVLLWVLYLLPLILTSSTTATTGTGTGTQDEPSFLINFEIVQAWSSLLASLILYSFLRYYQIQHIARDTVKLAFLARNHDAAHDERERASELLLSCLPKEIIQQLEAKEEDKLNNKTVDTTSFARHHDSVTVLFCQVCNIDKIVLLLDSALGHRQGSTTLVIVLNTIFTEFDRLMDVAHCKKIETVMDVYMAVCGAPTEVSNHADLASHCACLMMASKTKIRRALAIALKQNIHKVIAKWKMMSLVENVCQLFDIHVGLNSGSVNSGVIGNIGPRYKIFGDVVNTASRMESTAPYGVVQCSLSTSRLVTKSLFLLVERPPIAVKGKGEMTPFWVTPVATNVLTTTAPTPNLVLNGGGSGGISAPTQTPRSKDLRRSSTSVLRSVSQSTDTTTSNSHIAQMKSNEHLIDFIKTYNASNPYQTELTPTMANRMALSPAQYTNMGLYGLPTNVCKCGRSPLSALPPVILAYHAAQEKRYESFTSKNIISNLRKMAILTFVCAACLFWLDVNRYNNYSNGICETLKMQPCLYGEEHVSNNKLFQHQQLCAWNATTKDCFRNATVKSDATMVSGCQWTYDLLEGTNEHSAVLRSRVEKQLMWSLIIRFAGVGSFSVLLVGLTFSSWMQKNPFNRPQQCLGGCLTFGLGVMVAALSWASGRPGVASTICWVFLAMVTSNVRYLWRMIILISMSIVFGIVLYFYNPYKSDVSLCTNPKQFIGTDILFILFSIVSAGVPIAKKEAWSRREFARKETIAHSEKLLLELHGKTHDLLSALLPTHVVLLLERQQRHHERQAIAEYYSDVSIVSAHCYSHQHINRLLQSSTVFFNLFLCSSGQKKIQTSIEKY